MFRKKIPKSPVLPSSISLSLSLSYFDFGSPPAIWKKI